MAITVHQQPTLVTPAYNDILCLLSSTNYLSGDFRYVAEIKTSGGTTIAKLKTPVIYGTDKGVVNAKRILESYVTYDFDVTNTLNGTCPNQSSLMKYEIEIGEEWDGTEYLNQTSINAWIFNGAFSRRNYSTYVSGEWVMNSGTSSKFLTNQRSKRVKVNQWDWLYFIAYNNPLPFFATFVRYKSYDASGLLKTVDVTYTAAAEITTGEYGINKVPSGRNIANIDSGEITAGTMPIIHAAATYYTIEVYDNSNAKISETYTIYLNEDCTRYDSVNIYYLNPMGGFDSFMFNKVRNDTYQPNRKQMKRQTYELSGMSYAKNINKHEIVNYDTTERQTVVLNSDWINDAESIAMHELISSPVVFMQVSGESYYTPVTVSNDNWDQKETAVEGLFNVTLTVQLDSERLQRG